MKRLLAKALRNKFNMAKEDAVELAKTVENIFEGNKEVEDMSIDKYARSLFYELQREKLLRLRREEYKEKGKILRKYYWSFNNDVIREEANKFTALGVILAISCFNFLSARLCFILFSPLGDCLPPVFHY